MKTDKPRIRFKSNGEVDVRNLQAKGRVGPIERCIWEDVKPDDHSDMKIAGLVCRCSECDKIRYREGTT